MKCTGKEWDTCRVEKMGCTGCHYVESDEILKELGYELVFKKEDAAEEEAMFEYKNKYDYELVFYGDKTFTYRKYGEYAYIDPKLLKVIYMKYKELGWF